MEYLSMKIPLIYSIQIIHSTTTMYTCTYVHTPVHIVPRTDGGSGKRTQLIPVPLQI